jgi:hypothetical protein
MKVEEKIFVGVAVFLGAFATAIIVALLNAWAVTKMWAWFIVPIGMPEIGMANIYGLMLIANLMKTNRAIDNAEFAKLLISRIMNILLILGFGWMVHSYFM